MVKRLAVIWIRIATGEAGEGSAEICLGLGELAARKPEQPHGVIASGVFGIAAQRLLPVRLRAAGRMPILSQVQAREVQIVGCRGLLDRKSTRLNSSHL